MPTSPKAKPKPQPKPPQRKGNEFFYEDEAGVKQDAELHNPMLDDGDDATAKRISDKVVERLGIKPPKAK